MAILKPAPIATGESAALSDFASGSGFGGGAGKVYMGTTTQLEGKNQDYLSPAAIAQLSRRKQDVWASESVAAGDFYNWDPRKQGDFLAKGITGGLLSYGDGPMEAGKLWEKLVKEAAKYGKAGKKVSPFDLMATYVSASGGAGKNDWHSMGAFEVNIRTGEKRYVGPGTYLGGGKASQTDTRTDLTDPDTAKAIATKLFQDLMGRDPGAGELGAFATALHSAEAESPITQTTTTQYNMETGQPISQDSTSSGGVTAEGKAYLGEQQIKKKKEYGVTQAATTYQNAFDQLILGSQG